MKRFIKVLLIIFLVNLFTPIAAEEVKPIEVIVNNETLELDVPPLVINGRTLLPVRAIFEALGLSVEWDSKTKTVIGRNENTVIELVIDSNKAKQDNETIKLDVPAKIIDGRTLVPVRFIGESLGAQVEWDNINRIITITDEPTISIHFIDVGQADAIFIDNGNNDIIIDGGNRADGKLVSSYLKDLNTDDLELVISTHPDEDHLGGLIQVLSDYKVERIIKPDLSGITEVYKDFENLIAEKNIPVDLPEQGSVINIGSMKLTIISDRTKKYSDTNAFSVVTKLECGDRSFLFTGDAEAETEHDIINSGINIDSDVLKIGHHGSGNSSTAAFLNKVNPDYAVISVGKNNKYSHPDNLILDRLNLMDIATLRTDDMGTIIFTTDGTNLEFKTTKNTSSNIDTKEKEDQVQKNDTVIISNLDKKAEFIEITNTGTSDIDITNWILLSVTGEQKFTLPQCTIKPGQTIRVAGYDARDTGDFIWEEGSGIWNNSKDDDAELYDNNSNLIYKWDD